MLERWQGRALPYRFDHVACFRKGESMKKFAIFAVLLSLGLFVGGCGKEAIPPKKFPTPEEDAAAKARVDSEAHPPAAAPAPSTK
jgi:hypothetical protein